MANSSVFQIQSTAGAIPVRNEKGEISMQKVKVHRYISGKRPEYAPASSGEEESDEEMMFERNAKQASPEPEDEGTARDDPRLRRLQQRSTQNVERVTTNRYIEEPEVIARGEVPEETEEGEGRQRARRYRDEDDAMTDDEEEDVDETEMEERRRQLRERRLLEQEEDELMDVEEEGQEVSEESEDSEYEEYTDSEEETGPRLKPVFVRRKDRVTIQERDREEQKQLDMEVDMKKKAEERRRDTLRIVETENRKEQDEARAKGDPSDALDSGDDANDEVEYELWKQRELKRIKREKEAKEMDEKEKAEIERLRSMTEEERRLELRTNPRSVTNKGVKGKYKFLQKYYHRGAFFMDEEQDVFKRDFSQPTLEDHFNKTILPKVMQVKNFGRSGRTKYTHLVDQDTTEFDSPWVQETGLNMKFSNSASGGMKQTFEKPSVKKKRSTDAN